MLEEYLLRSLRDETSTFKGIYFYQECHSKEVVRLARIPIHHLNLVILIYGKLQRRASRFSLFFASFSCLGLGKSHAGLRTS